MKKFFKNTAVHLAILTSAASLLAALQPAVSAAEFLTTPSYYETGGNTAQSVDSSADFTLSPGEISFSENTSGITLVTETDINGEKVPLFETEAGANLAFDINCEVKGNYAVTLDYKVIEESTQDLAIAVELNGEIPFSDSREITLPAIWTDDSQDYKTDQFNNQVYPLPVHMPEWQRKTLTSTVYNLNAPLLFELNEGENHIEIHFNSVACMIGDITFGSYSSPQSYGEYASEHRAGDNVANAEPIVIEAEKYTYKSHSYIRGEKNRDFNYYPYSPKSNMINVLSGSTWSEPGNSVTYSFSITEPGIYYLALKYRQSEKSDMPVFKNILIDGKVPFDEFYSYAFPYTGSKTKTYTVSLEDQPAGIFFDAGEHTITFESTADPLYEIYESLQLAINEINSIALEVKKVTGNKIDKNRDWKLDEFLPDIASRLKELAETVDSAYESISNMVGGKDISAVSDLKLAASTLYRYSEDLEYFVNNISYFSEGGGSVAERVSLLLEDLLYQPMSLDRIFISPDTSDFKDESVGFFKAIWLQIQKLAYTFVTDYDTAGYTSEDTLNVWVGRSTNHVEALRDIAEREYDGNVTFSVMADEQKLIFAQSAGNGPDVVLGTTTFRPFDLALRGALYDLRQFPDFGEFIKDFHSEMLVMFSIDEHCYGIPETANFVIQFYRKDIMSALNLEVPETWDEVLEIIPVLNRYGMNYNTYLSNLESFKHFGATMPFINQFGGKLYSSDGTRVELGDPDTVEAFTLMTDLYTRYSLPISIPNFYNNFKKGITPIGISDISTYILLENAAPEIKGQWGIAPSVGVMNEDGTINNSQLSVMSGCVMMADSKKHEEGWDFLKWWLSADTQAEYTRDMYLRNGAEYIWNTANITALKESTSFDAEDLEIILAQIENTVEVPRNPAYYAVERELSNAWNRVVYNGETPRASLDKAILTCNRQIAQKLQEFGYMDTKGNLIKPFNIVTAEDVDRWKGE